MLARPVEGDRCERQDSGGRGGSHADRPTDTDPPRDLLIIVCCALGHQQKCMNRVGDVLQALKTQIDDAGVESPTDVTIDTVGDAYRSRPCERLETGGDVYRVTEHRS